MSIRKLSQPEVQKPVEFQITSEDAVKILQVLANDNPSYFNRVYAAVKQDEQRKRDLLQLQQNLTADLNSAEASIADVAKAIAEAKRTQKALNGKLGWLIRRKYELKQRLNDVHLEWIQKYSATGNASL